MNKYQIMKTIVKTLIVFVFLSSSCISITRSTLREPIPPVIEINDCKISSTGAVYLKMFGYIKTDFIPNSVKIMNNDLVIYCDPLVVEDTLKADFILITHSHMDHFSKTDINKLLKPSTILIAPKTVTKKYKHINNHAAIIGAGFNFENIHFEAVEAYNINSGIHKKGNKSVGYVISCDSARIYIAGDTDFIPEMKELKDITVAIVPIGEGKTAMNPQAAGEAVKTINPVIAIPVHYELNQNRESDFMKNVNNLVKVEFLHNFR